ncbi:hypothetical protein [Aeromonas salmonicida]|uniref:hypothetical protein n=1 Tax=Aeromonas salmonicida TaxID=645 RepID=UPI003D314D31
MTVPNIPFWLSDANTEFGGNGWASDICSKAGLALPADLVNLAGKSALSVLTRVPTYAHNTVTPYVRFMYDAASNQTKYLTNTPGSIILSLFTGAAWIRIRNGGITYQNCSEAGWFKADSAERGVILQAAAGTSRTVTVDFSASNGGAIIYSENITIVVG